MTAAVVIGVPSLISLGFRWWPHTYVGRQVLLDAPRAEDVLPDEAQRRQLKGLVGRLGRAKCRMLPSGVVSVDGQTLDATSEGMVIEAGQTVRIIKIEANRLVVRAVEGEIPTCHGRESRWSGPSTASPPTPSVNRWCERRDLRRHRLTSFEQTE